MLLIPAFFCSRSLERFSDFSQAAINKKCAVSSYGKVSIVRKEMEEEYL